MTPELVTKQVELGIITPEHAYELLYSDPDPRMNGEWEIEETRSSDMTIVAWPALYNKPTYYAGRKEIVKPGAFTNALNRINEGFNVRALFNHNKADELGSTQQGNLRLVDREEGLLAQLTLNNDEKGKKLYDMMNNGVKMGASFGTAKKKHWDFPIVNGVRELDDVDLDEVSIANTPVYPQTTASIVDISGSKEQLLERLQELKSMRGK